MKERFLIVSIALVVGLTLATIGFYIFKTTKNLPEEVNNKIASFNKVEPTKPLIKNTLEITEPKDESITDKRTITVAGKSEPGNTVIVSSGSDDAIQVASTQGDFSMSVTIDSNANILSIRSISTTGEETKKDIIITYNQEEF